ncbi:MAG: NHL repeat-containing protein, partial [bacterium]|nr:NHL repeat-containing protein [bacterium]
MATDAAGNFYLVDLCNNRVLRYDDPFETDQIADQVWGQGAFTNRSPNNIRTTPTASADTLHTQRSPNGTRTAPTTSAATLNTQGAYTSGVEVDTAGNIWIADTGNNRVLCFTNGATSATLVLGQASFTTSSAGTAQNQMYHPSGVRVHPQTREVFVLDGRSDRWPGPRVMVFRPPFSNGMRAQRVFGTNQLNWARGFCLDPFDTNIVWVADGANNRIIKFNHVTGQALDCIGQPNLTTFIGIGKYVRPDGTVADFGQPDGSISIDAQSNLYFTSFHDFNKVIRVPLPITRTTEGHVWSNGEMLKQGVNENSGRTMWGNYGMARWNKQLFVRDRYRIMVWTNYPAAVNFQAADLVIGQSAMDQNKPGGTFEGREIGMLHASSNVLFVTSDAKLFMFHLPITNGGRMYAPFKTIDGGQATQLKWADDHRACTVLFGGVCYDPASNVLWVAHNHSGNSQPGARVLRIRDPFATTPLVDLVLGQTNKTGGLKNKGKYREPAGPFTVDGTDMANPAHVFLDNYRNLYVVDSGYEGRIDNAGNRRVVRFDEAHTYPVDGTIFPNTAADAVFCKPTLTTARDYADANRPGTPITVVFNSANEMVLTDDTYDTPQGMHLFYYPAPQTGGNPQPTQIINTYLGQPAFCFFDG